MRQRAFFSAFAAILLSATLVQTAAAIVLPARDGATTVTGAYRPLNLDLTLVESYGGYTSELEYDPGEFLSLSAVFSGTFAATGDSGTGTGDVGYWFYQLVVSGTDFSGDGDIGVDQSTNQILLSASQDSGGGFGTLFGAFTYLGDGVFSSTSGALNYLPPEDTPQQGDVFAYYAPAGLNDVVVQIDSTDGFGSNFSAELLQPLQHLGPYVFVSSEGGFGSYVLEIDRQNLACNGGPCGLVFPLTVSSVSSSVSVPEPATLALLGLGLAGLGLSRRARA